VLQRDIDETGVSGTGIVAEGVEFSDGTVALRWTSAWPTSVVFHERGMDSVVAVHGHGGKTRIVWVDDQVRQENTDLRTLIDHPEALALVAGPGGSTCLQVIGDDETLWYRRHWRNALDQWGWWHRRYQAATGDERGRIRIEMDERATLRSTEGTT